MCPVWCRAEGSSLLQWQCVLIEGQLFSCGLAQNTVLSFTAPRWGEDGATSALFAADRTRRSRYCSQGSEHLSTVCLVASVLPCELHMLSPSAEFIHQNYLLPVARLLQTFLFIVLNMPWKMKYGALIKKIWIHETS